jgi:hypothetical protein
MWPKFPSIAVQFELRKIYNARQLNEWMIAFSIIKDFPMGTSSIINASSTHTRLGGKIMAAENTTQSGSGANPQVTASPDSMFDYPWEDSLIVVLRDLQWRIALENAAAGERIQLPSLVKFDGNAEGAIGDVELSVDDRFFILELKATASKMGTEPTKALPRFAWELLKERSRIDNMLPSDRNDEVKARFKSINELYFMSNACHYLVAPSAGEQGIRKESGVIDLQVDVEGSPYLAIAAVLYEQPSYKPTLSQKLFPLLRDKHEKAYGQYFYMGLSAPALSAYIKVLVAAHGGRTEKGKHPMKAVVWGTNGLIWPCVDLSDLAQLQEFLAARPELKKKADGIYQRIQDALNCPQLDDPKLQATKQSGTSPSFP